MPLSLLIFLLPSLLTLLDAYRAYCGASNGTTKFANRLYCPPGWVQCKDNFCAATEDVCLTKGGVKYSAKPCQGQ